MRVSSEDYERLEHIGLEMDRSVSWLIRKAISDYIERYKPAK